MIGGGAHVVNSMSGLDRSGPPIGLKKRSNESSGEEDSDEEAEMPPDDKITIKLLYKEIRKLRKTVGKNRKIIKQLAQNDSVSLNKLIDTFKIFDQDNSGSIDEVEFDQVLQHIGANVSSSDYDLLWQQLDADGSGELEIQEFVKLCKEQLDNAPDVEIDALLQLVIEAEMEKAQENLKRSETSQTNGLQVPLHGKYPHAPYKFKPSRKDWFARLRMEIHFVMEDEEYSKLSSWMFHIIMLFIITSTIAYVLETIPIWARSSAWKMLEEIVSIFFIAELILRLFACRNACFFWRKTFYFHPCYGASILNLVDFLAVLPYIIEKASGADSAVLRIIRVVRLTRLLRLRRFKAMRATSQVLGDAAQKTMTSSCGIVTMLIVFETIFFSAFVFVAECGQRYPGCPEQEPGWSAEQWQDICLVQGDDVMTSIDRYHCGVDAEFALTESGDDCYINGDAVKATIYPWVDKCVWNDLYSTCDGIHLRSDGNPSPFDSIPASVWWTMTTITTVGYGDVAPLSGGGQVVGVFCMLTGVVVVAIFVVIIAGNFDEALDTYKRKMAIEQQKVQLKMERELRDKAAQKELAPVSTMAPPMDDDAEHAMKDRKEERLAVRTDMQKRAAASPIPPRSSMLASPSSVTVQLLDTVAEKEESSGSATSGSPEITPMGVMDEKRNSARTPSPNPNNRRRYDARDASADLRRATEIGNQPYNSTSADPTSSRPGPGSGSDYDEPFKTQITNSYSDLQQRQHTYTNTENSTSASIIPLEDPPRNNDRERERDRDRDRDRDRERGYGDTGEYRKPRRRRSRDIQMTGQEV